MDPILFPSQVHKAVDCERLNRKFNYSGVTLKVAHSWQICCRTDSAGSGDPPDRAPPVIGSLQSAGLCSH